ncbi:MAG: DUF6518 family protein [Streptosporangiaceae bacterium]
MRYDADRSRPGAPRFPWPVAYLVVIAVGAMLGAGDQYLGSLVWPLASAVSLMSAPWLLLPFCIGCTQVTTWRAALMGFAGLVAALAGYTVMIMSPVEGVHNPGAQLILAVLSSQSRWLPAAVLAGPLYGVLGQRWRVHRSWVSALLAVSPLLFEPVSTYFRLEWGQSLASVAELAAGLAAAVYFVAAMSRNSRRAA